MQKNNLWGRVALLTAAMIWGSSFFVMKNALDGVPVYLLLAIRFTIGCGLMCAFFAKRLKRMNRQTLLHGCIIGALLFAAYAVQTFGLKATTPGKNAFLTAVYCVLVPFAGWLLFRRKPTGWHWFAAVLCLGGIGLVSLEGDLTINMGDGLTLIGGVIFALHLVAVSHFGEKDDAVLLTAVQFGMAALCSWGFSLATEPLPVQIPQNAWGELLYLAVFATTAALLLQNVGQSVTSAAPAAILLSLESVFGVLFSVIFYHEALTLRMMAGFLLIFLAVVASETQFAFLRPKRSASAVDEGNL